MESEKDVTTERDEGDKNPTTVPEAAPEQPTIESVAPVEASPIIQDEIPAQHQTQEEVPNRSEPLFVRVIEDDELSQFERKTIRYGLLGIAVSFLALVAACVTGYFIYGQFGEMAKQTRVLTQSLEKQKEDSAAAANSAAQQFSLLNQQLGVQQDQSTQQRKSLELDQRPWLKFQIGAAPDSEPNAQARNLPTFTAGQPLKIPIRISNIGKTTAEQIQGILLVQLISEGTGPILPRNRLTFDFSVKRQRSAARNTNFPALAGQWWYIPTLYPGEVHVASYSRMKYGSNKQTVDNPATINEINGLNAGTAHLFVVGQVWYQDVFGVKHSTTFCESSDTTPHTATLTCGRFNSVDNNHTQSQNDSHRN